MKYRYTFGQTLNAAELSPDEGFDNAVDDIVWSKNDNSPLIVLDTNVSNLRIRTYIPGVVGPDSNHRNWNIANIYSVANVFTKGERYHCKLVVGNVTAVQQTTGFDYLPDTVWAIEIFVGNMSTTKSHSLREQNKTIEFDLWALEDAPIIIQASIVHIESTFEIRGEMYISEFSVKKYDWNAPSDFTQLNDSKLTIEGSELFEGLKVEYLENVELFSDSYNYFKLLGLVDDPVISKVEYCYSYSTVWAELITGYVYTKDISYKRNSCLVTIESIYSTFLNASRDKQFSPFSFIDQTNYGGGWVPLFLVTYYWYWDYNNPIFISLTCHDITTGADIGGLSWGFNNFDFLRAMIHEYSDCLISLESSYFGAGGAFEYLLFTKGDHISYAVSDEHDFRVSFTDYMTNLNNIFTLGMVPDKVLGINYIKVEPLNSLRTAAAVNLSGAKNENWKYRIESFYASIEVGYEKENTSDGGTEVYNSIEQNAVEKFVRTCSFVRNSNQIAANLAGTVSTDYFFIEFYDSGASVFKSVQTGQDILPDNAVYSFNGLICFDAIMDMMLPILYLHYRSVKYPTVVKAGTETIIKKFEQFDIDLTFAQLLTLKLNPYAKIVLATSYENVAAAYLESLEFELATGKTFITPIG